MKKSVLVLIAVLLILLLVGGKVVASYNSLVKLSETIDGQWAQVENQLQRRNDLIPNLVNTVKGYVQHEEQVFTAIADARARLAGAATIDEKVEAADELQSALSRLLVVVENYPELKADAQFQSLFDEIAGTETRLAVERMRFNEHVRTFNTQIKQFPMLLFARFFGFDARAYFQVTPGAEEVPDVSF
jgi:LemA protein